MTHLLLSILFAFQSSVCHPSVAYATRVWYVPTGENASVMIRAYCTHADSATWYVSYFTGDGPLFEDEHEPQPTLWDWYGIQNTASELLEVQR